MNNEPVAWAYIKDGEFWDAIHPDEHDKYEGMYKTPLYTHPAKKLTDKVQFKSNYTSNFLSAYMAVRYDSDCANGHPLKGYQPIEDAQFLANEAWEILKKASEK